MLAAGLALSPRDTLGLDGEQTVFRLDSEYRFTEHFGVGAGIGSNSLEVVRERDNTRFEFDNRVTGLHLFVTAHF